MKKGEIWICIKEVTAYFSVEDVYIVGIDVAAENIVVGQKVVISGMDYKRNSSIEDVVLFRRIEGHLNYVMKRTKFIKCFEKIK